MILTKTPNIGKNLIPTIRGKKLKIKPVEPKFGKLVIVHPWLNNEHKVRRILLNQSSKIQPRGFIRHPSDIPEECLYKVILMLLDLGLVFPEVLIFLVLFFLLTVWKPMSGV